MVYLWPPGPEPHRCYFQHLSRQRWHYAFSSRPSCDLLQLTLHLYEELGLDPTCSFALVLTPGATEGVDLIDKNDGGLVFSG